MSDKDKYGETSIFAILILVIAIVLSLVFDRFDEYNPPLQEQIEASPFETNGLEKEEDW